MEMKPNYIFFNILVWICFLNDGSLGTGKEFGANWDTEEKELPTPTIPESDSEYEITIDESNIDGHETNATNDFESMDSNDVMRPPYFGCLNSCCDSSRSFCKCDELCSYYGDCCYNSVHREALKRKDNLECLRLPTEFDNIPYFTVATCPQNWTESSDIRDRCLANESFAKDPLFTVPLTNPVTGLIYKNRFCAVCNGEDEHLVEWFITARCLIPEDSALGSVGDEYIIENLEYDESRRGLGFWMDLNGTRTFAPCMIKFVVPEVIEKKLRRCLVAKSDCDESFRDSELEKLCEGHLDPVTVRGKGIHRNVYCALCNGENQGDFDCTYMQSSIAGPYAFNAIVNLNFQSVESDKVAKDGACKENEKYDPLFNRCRKFRGKK